ncbi:TolB family protein [Streptacidiphilus monticola]|uniref:TolB family protein n=1 Tax=Streptacidiphilus monticola TaxID=2161674 RepID=A0ABW1G3H4_9ACTN
MGMKYRLLAFVLLVLACAGAATGYTLHALQRDRTAVGGGATPRPHALDLTPGSPRLVFQQTGAGSGYGHVGETGSDGTGPRLIDRQTCERVYAAAGRLLCLHGSGGLIVHQAATLYDAAGRQIDSRPVPGLPSRARLSADGRMAAWTAFVYGDSYTSVGFSTRTALLDTRTGVYVPSLEEFRTLRGGRTFEPADRNFWGVSFARDDNTFYATLGSPSSGGTFLVRGDFAARTLTVLRSNVECPSLSPDGTRLAFKKKVSDDQSRPWRLYVLDLATMKETPLADSRSADDQADWLDLHTVAYALPGSGRNSFDIWEQPADGSGRPKLLLHDAASPSVIGRR